MFRRKSGAFEVLLVHPGGPFFANKDEGRAYIGTAPRCLLLNAGIAEKSGGKN
jgi:predicted NUDIX family NTP pyrophosphohydrolase